MTLDLVLLAAGVLFFLLLVSVCLIEKHRVSEFVPVDPDGVPVQSKYFVAVNESARQLGFLQGGVLRQERGSKVYNALASLWVASDCGTLLCVSGGKIAGIDLKRMRLISVTADGCLLETTDDFGVIDLSGLTKKTVLLNGDLAELWAHHQHSLAEKGGAAQRFRADQSLEAYEAIRRLQVERLEKLGVGRFLDSNRNVWRYTFKGALKYYWRGFRGDRAAGLRQAHRIHQKRPGE